MKRALSLGFFVAAAAMTAAACGDSPAIDGGGGGKGNGTGGGLSLGGDTGEGGTGPSGVCEQAESETGLEPVYLSFVFDVSGSMGQLDYPNYWHDPAKKWIPVTTATRAFFEAEGSSGISASLSLFPKLSDKCSAANYETPEVPFTSVPSAAFDAALDDYETEVGSPLAGGDWRGSTPTLAAFQGTLEMLQTYKADHPGQYVVVLVTDGVPAGCSDNAIGTVATEVASALDAGIRTFVIGVTNPTEPPAELPAGWESKGCGASNSQWCVPPNNLESLNALALAGGTEEALLIDTNDPEATQTAFAEAIDNIRASAVSCELEIPPNPATGGGFEPDYINPVITVGGEDIAVSYDPDCEGTNGWHFDDPADPTKIVLCESTCSEITGASDAAFNIEFLCTKRVDVN